MARMNREQAIREAIRTEIRKGAMRLGEQMKDFRDDLRDVQIKLDKLREEMDA